MAKQQIEVCSFCHKTNKQVKVLIASTGVAICDGCLTTAQELAKKKLEGNKSSEVWDTLTPKNIYDLLNQYIIGQHLAKRVLAVAVHNHIKRVKNNRMNEDIEIDKSNILLIGPTGSGKTYLAQTLAKILQLPIALGDATTLTQAGYVGEDVENLVARLYQVSKGDVKLTEKGIVFIDEIDKIARRPESASIGRDVSGEGVQQGLLKLVDGSEIYVPAQGTKRTLQSEQILINTKDILFIGGGAFVGLTDIINRRMRTSGGIGFTRDQEKKDISKEDYNILQEATEDDIRKFGLIPELIGRLPIVVPLQKLTEPQLIKILTEPKNALIKQYVRLFEENGVDLSFSADALHMIANHAIKIDLGARALRRLMEKILLEPMFEAADLSTKKLEVTTKMVEDGMTVFKRIGLADEPVAEVADLSAAIG